MKKLIWMFSLCMTMLACNYEDKHENEAGLAVGIISSVDNVSKVNLWIFDSNNALQGEYTYSEPTDLADNLFQLPSGKYTLVAGINLESPFSYTSNENLTLDKLEILLSSSVTNNIQVEYGSNTVTVDQDKYNNVNIVTKSLLKELAKVQIGINNIAEDIEKVSIEILNSAEGKFPANGSCAADSVSIKLGELTVADKSVHFPEQYVLPTVREDGITYVKIVFTTKDGKTIEMTVGVKNIGNVDNLDYNDLIPNIIIIGDIDGWDIQDEQDVDAN